MLELKQLSRSFGSVKALDQLDLRVRKGEILGLIGPNGSGKSTTVNLIAGLYKPSSGTLAFNGVDLAQRATHVRAALGIARTFHNIRLFANLSVWQNVWAARVVRDAGWTGLRKRWLSSGRSAMRCRSCSRSAARPATWACRPAISHSANSDAWNLRGRQLRAPSCCYSTNQPPA